jgi:hypothetical protein
VSPPAPVVHCVPLRLFFPDVMVFLLCDGLNSEGEAMGGVQGRPGPDHCSRLHIILLVWPVRISGLPILTGTDKCFCRHVWFTAFILTFSQVILGFAGE